MPIQELGRAKLCRANVYCTNSVHRSAPFWRAHSTPPPSALLPNHTGLVKLCAACELVLRLFTCRAQVEPVVALCMPAARHACILRYPRYQHMMCPWTTRQHQTAEPATSHTVQAERMPGSLTALGLRHHTSYVGQQFMERPPAVERGGLLFMSLT